MVAVNQTVLSLSAPLHTRRLLIQGMCVYAEWVNTHVHVHVCVFGVSRWFVFFIYRWLCPLVCVPGSVYFLCRDGLVMHWEVESVQTSSCLLLFVLRSVPCRGLSLSFLFLFVFSLLICHTLLYADSFIFFLLCTFIC